MSSKARNLTKLASFATTYSDRAAKNVPRTTATNTAKDAKPISELTVESTAVGTSSINDSKRELRRQLRNILGESEEDDDLSDLQWDNTISNSAAQMARKKVSRERKQVWDFNGTQNYHFWKFVKRCAERLGANASLEVLRTLDCETGVKEFNCVIKGCIEKARNAEDKDAALEEIHGVYAVLQTMSEHGFKIDEETYGPILMFMIDMGMVEEFHFFCDKIKRENPESIQRLAYFENELLLMIKLGI